MMSNGLLPFMHDSLAGLLAAERALAVVVGQTALQGIPQEITPYPPQLAVGQVGAWRRLLALRAEILDTACPLEAVLRALVVQLPPRQLPM